MLMFRAMLVYAPLRSWIGVAVVTITMLAMPADKAAASEFTKADMDRLEKLMVEEKCGEVWDILWNATLGGSPIATQILAISPLLGIYPPLPLPREDQPEVEVKDMLKEPWLRLYASATFAMDVRQLPKDNLDPLYEGDRQSALDSILGDKKSIKEIMQPDTYKEYEAEGCLSEHPSAKCFDTKSWGLPIQSLTDWDRQIKAYKTQGFKARCIFSSHDRRPTKLNPMGDGR